MLLLENAQVIGGVFPFPICSTGQKKKGTRKPNDKRTGKMKANGEDKERDGRTLPRRKVKGEGKFALVGFPLRSQLCALCFT